MPTRKTALAALGTAVALGASTLALAPTADAAPVSIANAQFRWGINNESNSKAFFGQNLFSAGKLVDPGQGAQMLGANGATWTNGKPAGWSASSGNVRIEKLQADGTTFASTTWAGTTTSKSGGSLGGAGSTGPFSDHQVVIDNGAGSLDPDTDSADIAWEGDFTVVYYSGFSFFYVSDPQLTLANGAGTVTATLDGFGSSQENGEWTPLEESEVTLATLSGVDVTANGLRTTPAYREVQYTAPVGTDAQKRDVADWGAFPQSFVDFQQGVGTASYWHSSGLSTDKNKPALPLWVLSAPLAVGQPLPGLTSPGVSDPGTTPTAPTTTPPAPATPAAPAKAAPAKTRAGKVALKVMAKPSPSKAGKARIKVNAAGSKPTGKVKVTLKSGKTTKKLTAKLTKGKATVKLPKLAKGTWTVTVTYPGDATYATAKPTKAKLTV
jgi:hypothetical protein